MGVRAASTRSSLQGAGCGGSFARGAWGLRCVRAPHLAKTRMQARRVALPFRRLVLHVHLEPVECPATAIPLGLHHGLPVGIQVVSSPGNDLLTLAMAVELEQAGIARCVSPVTQ